MRRPRPIGIWVRFLLALLPTLLLLAAGELAARVYYYRLHNYDARYLIIPFGAAQTLQPVPDYPVTKSTYLQRDVCSNRTITFTINTDGGRGPDWREAKSPGTVRILAAGASTTFGVNNPDGATWPAFLETQLHDRRGTAIEVLNGSQSAITLKQLTRLLSDRWLRYHPDLVIYYEAYNDTPYTTFRDVDFAINRFHQDSWFGRLCFQLHYRSMLYTYLVEKLHPENAANGCGAERPRIGISDDGSV